MESSIQTNGLAILWHPPHKKNDHTLCCRLLPPKIGGIQVNIQDHVVSVEPVLCIRVSQKVIQ